MANLHLRYIDAHQLKSWIHDSEELALLDVREHGQYGEDHLFFAVSLPYSELEFQLDRLVPWRGVRVALYGDQGSEEAVRASAQAMARLGYSNVHILRDGIEAWKAAGYVSFAGVNVPSKTFGEMVEHVCQTPSISANELSVLMRGDSRRLLIVDGRPVSEYRRTTIPGSVCCPNGELALRIHALAPDPDTTIVVNCAGRTRSIIGAQTLINLGISHKVYALENGTQGWYLQDLPLEYQANRLYPEKIEDQSLMPVRQRAQALRHRFKIPSVDAETVAGWINSQTRSVFLCDIRTEEEYAKARMPPRVQHAPGGQLIQATDQYIGVRKASIVLCDIEGIRAPVVASWLKQLGWSVFLLEDIDGLNHVLDDFARHEDDQSKLEYADEIPADDLPRFLKQNPDALLLDARPSKLFREGSIEKSRWIIRPNVSHELAGLSERRVLLMGDDLARLRLLAHELEANGFADIYISEVGDDFPQSTGLSVVSRRDMPDKSCIDYLFFAHERHEGNKIAAKVYLDWETNLLLRIDAQERATFSIEPLQE
ncbi:MAG: rhodanese-like domain-containing protein [Pigmentiphaga sp.]